MPGQQEELSDEERQEQFVKEMSEQWEEKTGPMIEQIQEETGLDKDEVLLYMMFNQISDIHNSVLVELKNLQSIMFQGLPGTQNPRQGGGNNQDGGIKL